MPDITPHSHKTILLIEDDVATRDLLTVGLERAGYNVISAWKKIDILALLDTLAADLVITDMIMRDIDGVEVITILRRTRPNAPVLAISGGGVFITSELSLKLAKSVGAIQILVKPFGLEQFLTAVEAAIKGNRQA